MSSSYLARVNIGKFSCNFNHIITVALHSYQNYARGWSETDVGVDDATFFESFSDVNKTRNVLIQYEVLKY